MSSPVSLAGTLSPPSVIPQERPMSPGGGEGQGMGSIGESQSPEKVP